MKIHLIEYDTKYDCSLEVDCDDDTRRKFTRQFDGQEMKSYLEEWNPPPCYHLDSNPAPETFLSCYHILSFGFYDTLLTDKGLITLLEAYGEMLPIPCSDSDKTVYQYLCMNCIGSDSEFVVHQEDALWKAMVYPEKISFRASQIPDQGLFSLSPHTTRLYTVENEELGIGHNFKMLCEARGYTGLTFTEIKLI
jgi:hypothetical protein